MKKTTAFCAKSYWAIWLTYTESHAKTLTTKDAAPAPPSQSQELSPGSDNPECELESNHSQRQPSTAVVHSDLSMPLATRRKSRLKNHLQVTSGTECLQSRISQSLRFSVTPLFSRKRRKRSSKPSPSQSSSIRQFTSGT